MNWQQRVWKGTGIIWHASCPLFLYLFMPGIVMSIGKVIRSYAHTNEEFIAESGNFYTFLGTLLVGVILYRRAKKKETTIREQATLSFENVQIKLAGYSIVLGVAISLFLSSLLTLVQIPYLSDSYRETAGAIYNRTDLLLVLILVGFLSPIIEEIIFRGYMLNRLLEYFQRRTCVMLSSAIFAICHVNLLWMLYSFCMGIFLGELAIKKDNILYSICVHIGFNLPAVLIAAVQMAGHGSSLFFQNKLLIFCYGLIGCAAGKLLWMEIKKEVGESW